MYGNGMPKKFRRWYSAVADLDGFLVLQILRYPLRDVVGFNFYEGA